MENFESVLHKAISRCNGEARYYTEFCKIYTFTTENISGYLKYFDLNNKSLLTVGSSGDQILNAYFKGAKDITLYDINIYAKYYVYLKIASILCLDYKEFQEFFFEHGLEKYYNNKMFSTETFNKIKSTLRLLDYESYLFFDELFQTFPSKQIRENLFNDDEYRNEVIRGNNIYLRNEITYNKLKSIIKKINFQYINGDIFKDDIPGKFDNIFLSNLCSRISDIDKLNELMTKLDKNNLKINGSILLGYLWETKFNSDYYEKNWHEIYNMKVTKEKLKDYITEYYNIKGWHNFLWKETKKDDLVLIYRKSCKK